MENFESKNFFKKNVWSKKQESIPPEKKEIKVDWDVEQLALIKQKIEKNEKELETLKKAFEKTKNPILREKIKEMEKSLKEQKESFERKKKIIEEILKKESF
jgi:predicted transcriptional regulator